jgi:hypothetical protein
MIALLSHFVVVQRLMIVAAISGYRVRLTSLERLLFPQSEVDIPIRYGLQRISASDMIGYDHTSLLKLR